MVILFLWTTNSKVESRTFIFSVCQSNNFAQNHTYLLSIGINSLSMRWQNSPEIRRFNTMTKKNDKINSQIQHFYQSNFEKPNYIKFQRNDCWWSSNKRLEKEQTYLLLLSKGNHYANIFRNLRTRRAKVKSKYFLNHSPV